MRTDGETAGFMTKFLSHYGKKGMRWGQRSAPTPKVTIRTKGSKNKAKTSGGQGHKLHKDAAAKLTVAQVKKKSGVNALSDEQLQSYARRLQLEQQVKGLEFNQKSAPRKFIANLLGTQGKQAANQVANEATTKGVKRTMAAAAAKKAAMAA